MILGVKRTRERGTYTVKHGLVCEYVIVGFFNDGEPFRVECQTKNGVKIWLNFNLGKLK